MVRAWVKVSVSFSIITAEIVVNDSIKVNIVILCAPYY